MRLSAIAAHSTCQPGRPAPERRRPAGLPGPRGPPQQGVEFVGLAGPVRVAAALGEQPQHGLAVIARLVAELRRGVRAVVDVRVFVIDDVRRPRRQHLFDEFDHLGDRLGRPDILTRRQHPQRGHVLAEQGDLAIAELAPVDTVARGALEQRIVDVGDVLHVMHVVTEVQPQPMNQVERQIGGRVAQMSRVVRRDPADVHGGGRPGRHRAHLPIRGVVQP